MPRDVEPLPCVQPIDVVVVADESARPESIAQTFLDRRPGPPNRTVILLSTSATLVTDVRRALARRTPIEHRVHLGSAVVPDLRAAAAFVARRESALLTLRLAQPRLFLDALRAVATSTERRAAA